MLLYPPLRSTTVSVRFLELLSLLNSAMKQNPLTPFDLSEYRIGL